MIDAMRDPTPEGFARSNRLLELLRRIDEAWERPLVCLEPGE